MVTPPIVCHSFYSVHLAALVASIFLLQAQIATEKCLRKYGCRWDLVLSASHALARNQVS